MNRRSRPIGAALVAALGLVLLAPAAPAQQPGDPGAAAGAGGPVVVNSWALGPTGTDPNEPSSRPNLTYELAPGASVADSVTLWNYGNTQMNFRIYATDAFNNNEGGFDLLAGDKAPVDAGTWVTMPQPYVTVNASSRVDLPITVRVPPDARAGDHAAAILASSEIDGRGPDNKLIRLDRRTGTRLYIRVAGPLQPQLAVEGVRVAYHSRFNPFGGSASVSYTIRNVGNVRLGAHHRVEIENPFGKTMKRAAGKDFEELLPGGAVVVNTRLEKVTATALLRSRVVATPFTVGSPGAPQPEASGTARTWAIPWSIVIVVALLALGWRWRRARRRRAGDPGEQGDGEVLQPELVA